MVEIVQFWRFYDFVKGTTNVIEEWRNAELGFEGQQWMDAALKVAAKTENHLEWGARDLKGAPKKEKIYELKFIADKKQYRLAFMFQPGREVILLNGFYHKGTIYRPSDAIKTARIHAEDYRGQRATRSERKIKFDS